MNEATIREDLVMLSRSLFEHGYSVGSASNISVAVADGILITPTSSCLGFLDPGRIAKLDANGNHLSGDKPSKEVFLRRVFYETRARIPERSCICIQPMQPLYPAFRTLIRTPASQQSLLMS